MTAESMPKKAVFTVREVADYLRLHPGTVYRLARDGRIPGFKIGSDWRFNKESIDRWRIDEESRSAGRTGRQRQ